MHWTWLRLTLYGGMLLGGKVRFIGCATSVFPTASFYPWSHSGCRPAIANFSMIRVGLCVPYYLRGCFTLSYSTFHTSSVHEPFPGSTNGYDYCTISYSALLRTHSAPSYATLVSVAFPLPFHLVSILLSPNSVLISAPLY